MTVKMALQGISYAGLVLIFAGEAIRKTAMVGQSAQTSNVHLFSP